MTCNNNIIRTLVVQTDNRPNLEYVKLTKQANELTCKLFQNSLNQIRYQFIQLETDQSGIIHPATEKIFFTRNVISKYMNEVDIVVFLDSDAWINDINLLNELIYKIYNADTNGAFSRDPYFDYNTYINSGSFIIKVNQYIIEMYDGLVSTVLSDKMHWYSWPYDQYYISNFVFRNKDKFIILKPDVLNTPNGIVLRHNWDKNIQMYEDLNLILKKIKNIESINDSFDWEFQIDNEPFPNKQ